MCFTRVNIHIIKWPNIKFYWTGSKRMCRLRSWFMRVNFTYIILNCLSNANRISIKVKFVKNHTGQLILLVTRWLRHYDCVPIQLGGHRNKKNLISKIVAPPCLVRFSFYLYAQIVKLLLQLMSIHMYMICPHNLSFIYIVWHLGYKPIQLMHVTWRKIGLNVRHGEMELGSIIGTKAWIILLSWILYAWLLLINDYNNNSHVIFRFIGA